MAYRGRHRIPDRARARRPRPPRRRRAVALRYSLPAIQRRHHREVPRRDADPRPTGREHAAGARVVPRLPRRGKRDRGDGAAHVPCFFLDHQLPAVHQAGRPESADYESQRHARVREGVEHNALDGDDRRQHPVQRTAQHAGVHRTVAERWQAVTRRPIFQGYGLTETSPFVTCSPLDGEYSGSIGLPIPSTEIAIMDDENRELPPGAEGEICVKGPQVMAGYWQLPGETAAAFTPDGWLRTGDIGIMDEDGYMRITDRKKDMILVSGFNVYPNEIENVIAAVPCVVECGVIGVPDIIAGELVKAFVVSDNPSLSADQIVAFCRQNLTNYKVPKIVEFRSELPKTPVGKILRRELRAIDIADQAASVSGTGDPLAAQVARL